MSDNKGTFTYNDLDNLICGLADFSIYFCHIKLHEQRYLSNIMKI